MDDNGKYQGSPQGMSLKYQILTSICVLLMVNLMFVVFLIIFDLYKGKMSLSLDYLKAVATWPVLVALNKFGGGAIAIGTVLGFLGQKFGR